MFRDILEFIYLAIQQKTESTVVLLPVIYMLQKKKQHKTYSSLRITHIFLHPCTHDDRSFDRSHGVYVIIVLILHTEFHSCVSVVGIYPHRMTYHLAVWRSLMSLKRQSLHIGLSINIWDFRYKMGVVDAVFCTQTLLTLSIFSLPLKNRLCHLYIRQWLTIAFSVVSSIFFFLFSFHFRCYSMLGTGFYNNILLNVIAQRSL